MRCTAQRFNDNVDALGRIQAAEITKQQLTGDVEAFGTGLHRSGCSGMPGHPLPAHHELALRDAVPPQYLTDPAARHDDAVNLACQMLEAPVRRADERRESQGGNRSAGEPRLTQDITDGLRRSRDRVT